MIKKEDLIPLRKFKENETHELFDAAIQEKIVLYVQSTRSSELIELSPAQIQIIRSYHPKKVRINVDRRTMQKYNDWMERFYTETISQEQVVAFSDLWAKRSEVDALFKTPDILPAAYSQVERSMLLKIILGMAISAYGFKPGERNTASGSNRGSIRDDLENLGFKISEDTVRKYLNEAVKLLGDEISMKT